MLNKYIFLFVGFGILCLIGLGGSYTAPTYNDINFSLCTGYTAPTYNDINFTLGESDTCDSCTYSSGNWEVDCSDDCAISSNVAVGGNDISILGTGTFVTTANITGYGNLRIEGTDSSNICKVTCLAGGCFKD